MDTNSVSVVLPTYKEASNIVSLVQGILDVIPPDWAREVLVVDDNSPDDTFGVVSRAFADHPCVRPILRTTDRGFAKSIRTGIEKANGHYVIVMDSDFTHDPVEIPKLLHVVQIYDVVSASRFCAGGQMTDIAHYLVSMLYNWMLRIILHTQVQDNLGGYYVIRRDHLLRLPFDRIFHGYGDYFFRLIFYAQKSGLRLVEIPAHYINRVEGASKSSWLRMFYSYTISAVRTRICG